MIGDWIDFIEAQGFEGLDVTMKLLLKLY